MTAIGLLIMLSSITVLCLYLSFSPRLIKLRKDIKLEKANLQKNNGYKSIRELYNNNEKNNVCLCMFILFNVLLISGFIWLTSIQINHQLTNFLRVSFIGILFGESYFILNYKQKNRLILRQRIVNSEENTVYLEIVNLLIEKANVIKNAILTVLVFYGIGFFLI